MKILLSIILFSFYINSKSQITIQSLVDSSGNSLLQIANNLEFDALGISNYGYVLNNANLSSPLLLTNTLNYSEQRNVFTLDTNFNFIAFQTGSKKLPESDIDYTNESLNFDVGVKCFLTGEHIKTRNNSRLFVVNSLDTTKKVFIDSVLPLGFMRLETELYSRIKTKHYDSGHIYDIYQDSIYLSRSFYKYEVFDRNLNYIYHSEMVTVLNRTYNYTLSLNDSLELQYSTSLRYGLHDFSKYIGLFSFGTAAIAAPLFSINYSEGGFNENRYFRVAGYSMSATAICAIVYLTTFDKKFKLVKKGTVVNENYWYLDYY
ncbi:MAG: hypothetical protein WAT43_07130 [Chitinophagales bacterium]